MRSEAAEALARKPRVWDTLAFDASADFVAKTDRSVRLDGRWLDAGEPIDKSQFTTRRLQQLFGCRKIIRVDRIEANDRRYGIERSGPWYHLTYGGKRIDGEKATRVHDEIVARMERLNASGAPAGPAI